MAPRRHYGNFNSTLRPIRTSHSSARLPYTKQASNLMPRGLRRRFLLTVTRMALFGPARIILQAKPSYMLTMRPT